MIVREDGEANFYTILDRENHWLAHVQLNGELTVEEQRRVIKLMANAADLHHALEEAKEAMDERRDYCRDSWDWKYKERWDREDKAVNDALEACKP